MQPKKRIQSHRLSPEELKEIQRVNADGDQLPTIAGNVISDVEIKDCEKHLVHVRLENKTFNRNTGEKESKAFVQTFYPNEFDRMVADKGFPGLSVEIVHDPRRNVSRETLVKTEGGDKKEKSLSVMNKEELKAKYLEVYGEEAPDMTNKELQVAITERIEFLEAEKASQNQ